MLSPWAEREAGFTFDAQREAGFTVGDCGSRAALLSACLIPDFGELTHYEIVPDASSADH